MRPQICPSSVGWRCPASPFHARVASSKPHEGLAPVGGLGALPVNAGPLPWLPPGAPTGSPHLCARSSLPLLQLSLQNPPSRARLPAPAQGP